jgi:HEAT repeat protein
VIAAVLPLADLLRHSNEETRAAAWYALEAIGTPEAMTELNRKR